jgi:hypothetical protein
VVVNAGCSCSHQRAFSTQGSGHAREHLSLIGPLGSARCPDSVVAEMSGQMVIRVGDVEDRGNAWHHLRKRVSEVHDGQGEADAGRR